MYKSSLIISTLLSCSLSLPAFAAETSDVIATINDVDITRQDYSGYAGVPPNANIDPNIINDMINRELMVQKASKDGLDKDPAFVNILDNLKYNALFDFALQKNLQYRELVVQQASKDGLDKDPTFVNILANLKYNALFDFAQKKNLPSQPISDERLRQEYDNFKPLKQYKLRQIFIPKLIGIPDSNLAIETAKNLIQEVVSKLETGGNFAQLAAQYTTSPMVRSSGGDLGWLTEENMLPEIAQMVVNMEKSTYSKPIESKMGWHIILVEDIGELPVIPFDQAREQLMAIVHEKMMVEHYQKLHQKLRGDAKIKTIINGE